MSVAGTAIITAMTVVWTACCCIAPVQSVFHFYMSRQAQSGAPCNYGCLSHAVGASQSLTARQRGEVVQDGDDQISRLAYQDVAGAGPHRGGPRDESDGEIMGVVEDSLSQAQPGGGECGPRRGSM